MYLFVVAVALLRCGSPTPPPALVAPQSVQQLTSRLSSDLPPSLSEETLLAMIPTAMRGFEIKERKVRKMTIDGRDILEAQLVGVQPGGKYMACLLTDYGADSLSYLYLYRRYLQESPAESFAGSRWAQTWGGFAWYWSESGSEIYYLEAGLLDRYHLRLRSNVPDSWPEMERMATSFPWDKLPPR